MVQILSEINLRMASELEERFLARPTSSKVGTELPKYIVAEMEVHMVANM